MKKVKEQMLEEGDGISLEAVFKEEYALDDREGGISLV